MHECARDTSDCINRRAYIHECGMCTDFMHIHAHYAGVLTTICIYMQMRLHTSKLLVYITSSNMCTGNRSQHGAPCAPSPPHTPPPNARGRRDGGGLERGGTAKQPQQQVTAKLQSFPPSTSAMGQPQPTWCAPRAQPTPHTATDCSGQTQ